MTNTPLKPCSTCKDGVYIVKAGTDECADCGRKEITPPAPVADDAVEALEAALCNTDGIYTGNDFLSAIAERMHDYLSSQGFTITRAAAPMTENELELEADKIAKNMFEWVDSVNATFIVDLAKKYRG